MDSYAYLANEFRDRIEAIANAVDELAPKLESASTLLFNQLVRDQKLLICAASGDAFCAEYIARSARQGDQDSAAIPCIAFTTKYPAGKSAALLDDLRPVCRDGDVLLVIDTEKTAPLVKATLKFAYERNLHLLLLSEVSEADDAVCIPIVAVKREIRTELALMASHSLLNLLQRLMIGEL
ncbi:MAG: hypothetical protein AAF991_00405 [Pseudomonadota bacterium]